MKKGFWKKCGVQSYPALAKVALRVLELHATSAATERISLLLSNGMLCVVIEGLCTF